VSAVRVLDLFPGHFDQNGDSGNLLALHRRLEWSGFDVEQVRIDRGDAWPTAQPDFVLIGGGSIPAQRDALPHLLAERDRLREWVATGTAYLAAGGGYALSATTLRLPGEGEDREGLGIVTGRAIVLDALCSGPTAFRSGRHGVLHGFVNLAQRVVLDAAAQALGTIEVGPWPDSGGGSEGAEAGTVYGTHAHGPILPKNPAFADAVIRAGLARRGFADAYRLEARHAHVDGLARRARASLAARLGQPPPD